MVVIEHAHRPAIARSFSAKGLGGRLDEPHRHAPAFGLRERKSHTRLSVFAAFEGGEAQGHAGVFGLKRLVFGQLRRRVGRPPGSLVKTAQLIMSGRMIRLELEQRFKLLNRVLRMPRAFLRQPKLES